MSCSTTVGHDWHARICVITAHSDFGHLKHAVGQIHSNTDMTQVLRGYIGDRSSRPVWAGNTLFNILGKGYQRPFELATLRLSNMVNILPRCEHILSCGAEQDRLTQNVACMFAKQHHLWHHQY